MEISKDGFGSLPKEIVQQIISYLDQNSETTLRATNRLFRALLFKTDFEITSNDVDWSDVSDRLLKHYNTTLIGLNINLRAVNHDALVESISKLSNLSTLNTSGGDLSAEQFQKLTDLVNLREFDIACKAPSAVVSYWSNLTKLRCYHKNNSEFPFSSLLALKQLQLYWPDVDLSKNTNLTMLSLRSPNTTLEHLVKLRTLNITSQLASQFLSFLTDLEDLQIDSYNRTYDDQDSHFLQFINSKRLTRLYILAAFHEIYYGHLTRLTTLNELTILESGGEHESSGRIDLSTLANLTSLVVQTANISDFEEVSKLTKLKELEVEVPRDCYKQPFNATLSALTNLEQLRLHNLEAPNIESSLCFMKHLTDLIVELNDNSNYKFLEIVPIELFYNRGLIRSGQFWSTVTKCTTLQSLIHTCESVDDNVIYSLTALSHLTQLSFRYTGQVNQECFTALTMLQTLDFTTLGDGTPVSREWLLEHMTWLKDLYVS